MPIYMKIVVITIAYSRSQYLYNLFSFYNINYHQYNIFIPQFLIRQLINFFLQN
jgi:hypothetical protein